jgi:periplasmic protein TonB
MKIILTLLTLFFTINTFAQKAKHKPTHIKVFRKTVKPVEDVVFQKVENEAGFIGGQEAWQKFIQTNLKADVPGNNGAPAGEYTVLVRFTIYKDGSLNDFVLENNPGYGTGEEVIRLLKTSPNWRPAMQSGNKVKAIYRQPINFVVL